MWIHGRLDPRDVSGNISREMARFADVSVVIGSLLERIRMHPAVRPGGSTRDCGAKPA
jgi:hypothetical protein